ncbi:MAG: hypothetical protein ACRD0A_19065 [Acidimicrobiales bacterium]
MPVDFSAIYDEATAARLARTDPRPRSTNEPEAAPVAGAPVRWRRRAVTGGLLTGLTLGLREVFDPPPDDEVVQEVDVDAPPLDDRPVRFVMVEGAPPVSRIILRPWLSRA